MRDAFSTYHPCLNFLYFALVMLFGMFFLHPVCLLISLVSAFAYAIYLNGRQGLRFILLFILPMMFLAMLLNPAFNHEGQTILFYLWENPITWESIAYGLAAGTMLSAIICWFSCYNRVMTSDKFIYLFGRVIPALSLILSMALRFVPQFKDQIKVISQAQRCIGRDVGQGNLLQRARHGIRILSIMVTWALENAIETADSMRSRGYGLKGRTAFSLYRFDSRDKLILAVIAGLGLYVLAGAWAGGVYYRYFPSLKGVGAEPFSLSVYGVYLTLCLLPLGLNWWEDRTWRRLQSKT